MGVNLERKPGVNLMRKPGGQFGAEIGGQFERIFHLRQAQQLLKLIMIFWLSILDLNTKV